MKTILTGLFLLLAAALPARAEMAWLALSPIPYGFVAPPEIASRLSTGPLTGTWAEQVEAAGIQNVLTKCIGSNNPHNMVRATITALGMLRTPEDIARSRGKEVAQLGVTV